MRARPFSIASPYTYLSPCGRDEVDPVAFYGFREVQTGGICRALDLILPDGCVLRLTDEDGLRIPEPGDWESAIVGRLSSDYDEIAWCSLGEVPVTRSQQPAVRPAPAAPVNREIPLRVLERHTGSSVGEESAGLSSAARDVLAERRRQIEVKGFSPEHDRQYDLGELPAAAACYALFAQRQVLGLRRNEPDHAWPWSLDCWKPGDARRALVKAAALLLAEIERLDHA